MSGDEVTAKTYIGYRLLPAPLGASSTVEADPRIACVIETFPSRAILRWPEP